MDICSYAKIDMDDPGYTAEVIHHEGNNFYEV